MPPPVAWSDVEQSSQQPTVASQIKGRRRSVLRSIRMSMSISASSSSPFSSSPPDPRSPSDLRSPSGPSPPLAPSSLPASYSPSALNSVRTLPAPQQPPPISTSLPQPSSSSSLLGSPVSSPQLPAQSGVGAKFKHALLANRRKKTTQGSGSTGSEWDDSSASSPTSMMSSPQQGFPALRIVQPSLPPLDGSLALDSPTSPPPRIRLESKISAFTAGLRKHHAIMSNPPISPNKPGPIPPPKPPGLRSAPSNSNLQLEKDQPLTPKSSDTNISNTMRPLTPTIVAAQNLAAASSIMPKGMTGLASRVVGASDHGGSGSGRMLNLPSATIRNSFQMPDSPSISAALSYMQNIPPQRESRNYEQDGGDDEVLYSGIGGGKDKEKKREQRRSAAAVITTTPSSGLKPVPEGSSMSSYASLAGKGNTNVLADLPPRTDSLQDGGLSRGTPTRGSKRRSASLGDVFRGGFTPAMARAAVTLPQDQEKLNATVDSNEPARGSPLIQSGRPVRPTHFRAGSSGHNPPANQNPVAAAYQYINAEVDGKAPFLAPKLPSPAPSPQPSPMIPPAHPMRKKPADMYASGNESSGAESAFGRGLGLRGGLKGRLAAWTAAATAGNGPPPARGRAQSPHPPGAYPGNTSISSTSTSPASPPSSLSVVAAENMLGASYSRTRSNSSNALPMGSSSPSPPNPKRLTATIGNTRSAEPSPRPNYYPDTPPKDSGYISSSTNNSGLASVAAGSIGAASGMALNLGKKGWDRMGNFLGHRAGQSGSWGLSGYGSTGEDSTRDSAEGGTMSDSGSFGYGTTSSSGGPSRMLGTMVRPPTRKGRGAVFGARLETCVRETRIVVRGADGREPPRGQGAWVTALVTRCIEHLMHWGMEEEGLFRINGRSTHTARIRTEFDTGADYILRDADPSDLDPHSVSSILKAYLRELPEPILTKHLASQFDTATLLGSGADTGSELGVTAFGGTFGPAQGSQSQLVPDLPTAEAMVELRVLIGRLPKENYDLLLEISKLLRTTASHSKATKMPLTNLLLLFCPSLQLSPFFLKIVVERLDYLFGNGDMGPVAPSQTYQADFDSTPSLVESGRARASNQSAGTITDENRKNRTASVYLPPGFSFTVEAFPDGNPHETSIPSHSIPSQPIIPTVPPMTSDRCATPSSSSGSYYDFPASGSSLLLPSPRPTPRPRQASSARRQGSLASLFSTSKKSAPTISNPIPIAAPTPASPPTLDIDVPTGRFMSSSPGFGMDDLHPPPLTPPVMDSPQTSSDSENFSFISHPTPISRPVLPKPIDLHTPPQYSPPPQLTFGSPRRDTGDDWAKSVLMAAGGSV